MNLYKVEYEYQGRVWATLVEARDADHARRKFTVENPGVPVVAVYAA